MFKHFKASSMIHSLKDKREVLIVSYENANDCRAVFVYGQSKGLQELGLNHVSLGPDEIRSYIGKPSFR